MLPNLAQTRINTALKTAAQSLRPRETTGNDSVTSTVILRISSSYIAGSEEVVALRTVGDTVPRVPR
jgi:hypothetical protein